MPLKIGLTGSIGMGKSTTAAMFEEMGIPIWDADAAVGRLYVRDGAAVAALAALRADIVQDGAVDRAAMRAWIAEDASALGQIEKLVHPLVQADRAHFLQETDAPILLFDIPLLFEAGIDAEMDVTVVVSTSSENQKSRVMARQGMTQAHFEHILSKQMPDADKRKKATYVIDTTSLETARCGVRTVLDAIAEEQHDA